MRKRTGKATASHDDRSRPQHTEDVTEKAAVTAARVAFKRFLRSKGLRITQARCNILDNVLSRHDHFRAEQVIDDLATGRSRVSRGTVYSTIALMKEAGLVREIRGFDTHSHYEHVYGHEHHEHMICERCGTFVEFSDSQVLKLIKKACRNRRFKESSHRLVILGTCKLCRAKPSRKSV